MIFVKIWSDGDIGLTCDSCNHDIRMHRRADMVPRDAKAFIGCSMCTRGASIIAERFFEYKFEFDLDCVIVYKRPCQIVWSGRAKWTFVGKQTRKHWPQDFPVDKSIIRAWKK